MRYRMTCLLAGLSLLAPLPATTQTLAHRVAAAPADEIVRFTFESRAGVCGDGENIRVRTGTAAAGDRRGRGIVRGSGSGDAWLRDCTEGPVQMEITREGRRIRSASARVGGAPRTGGTDLGAVATEAAVSFLLSPEVLGNAAERAAERMVFAATLANAESWPALLRAARTQDLASGVRRGAVFWLAQAAGSRAAEGLSSIIGDESDEMDVRRHAVFALSRIPGGAGTDALMDIARTSREPEIRRQAMFWLGQDASPRVLAFFEEILRG